MLPRREIGAPRRCVAARCENRTVFASPRVKHCVDLETIDALLSSSAHMSEASRRDLFASHGVDYDRVRDYYAPVRRIEESFEKSRRTDRAAVDYAAVCWYLNRIATLFMLWASGRL